MKSKSRIRIAEAVGDAVLELWDAFRLLSSSVSFVCLRLGGEVTDELGWDSVVVVVVVVVDVLVEVLDVVLGTSDPLFRK